LATPGGENIQVMARFRPMSDQEFESQGERECVEFGDEGNSCVLAVEQPKCEVEFTFNRVFQPMASQSDVYEAVSPIVMSVINGINSSILAYGQTGSGKTHTMMGPQGAKALINGDFDDAELGVIPRALLELQDHAQRSDGAVSLYVSYIEIYQEKVHDLLKVVKSHTGSHGQKIDGITEDLDKALHLPDVVQMPVQSARDALELMQRGNKYRTKASTQMNHDSSRSHALFIVSVSNDSDPANRKFAQLYLVDLAGSERADKTGVWGKQLDEAKIINKSLLALGQVIVSLSEKAAHIPYRDSKLTRILQNVLGGNSRTAMICAVSPHPDNANESLSTLRFGSRASKIRNEARMNIVLDAKELKKQLDKAHEEIADLKRENATLRQSITSPPVHASSPSVSMPSQLPPHNSTEVQPSGAYPTQVKQLEKSETIVAQRKHVDSSDRHVNHQAESPDFCEQGEVSTQHMIAQRLFARKLLPALICPLTQEVMRDPVCAADGATYEREAFERHVRQAGRMPAMSPVTGKLLPSKQFVANVILKQLITSNVQDLPPQRARFSSFAKVSIYLLDHIFSFCNGKALCLAQQVCKDFLAVGSEKRLWAQLVRAELGHLDNEEDPRQQYIKYAAQVIKHKPSLPQCKGLTLVVR
jgi:hypothetical protein